MPVKGIQGKLENREYQRKYRQGHLEKVQKNEQEYRQKHLEKLRENERRYRQRHPERVRESRRKSWQKHYLEHRDQVIARNKENYRKHKLARSQYSHEYCQKRKATIMQAYGGKCACCGESNLCFLCLDHIDGGGTQHRYRVGVGQNFYIWIVRQNFPAGYQVLCYNCNMAKESPGGCPHKYIKESKEELIETLTTDGETDHR